MRTLFLLTLLLGLVAAALVVTTETPIEDPIWWLSNESPPRVAIQGPAGPLRGPAEALVRLEQPDRVRIESITLDGQPLATGGARLLVDSATLPDGLHRVAVVVRDHSRQQNRSTVEWTFTSDNTPPRLDVRLEPEKGPVEGRTVLVRVHPSEPAETLRGNLEGRDLRLQTDGNGGFWAVVGIPPEPAYRTLRLTVKAQDALGNEGGWEKSYPLTRTKFPEEVLEYDPAIDNLGDSSVRALELAKLMPVYNQPNGERRWEGRWREPVSGEITTEFATRRGYNGRFADANHLGVDFAVPMGHPVKAPAAGVAVYSGQVPVRGNVLIVDHGAGVYSTYAHLQRSEVEVGDPIAAGDVIARVGSTGLSTGPHLHWEVWVDSAAVDPLEWTQRSFP